jgi:MoxR-like ATPase
MVYADRSVKQYISAIVNATRFPKGLLDDRMAEYIRIGASPRASIAFLRVAKAVALMRGRTYVTPDDVKEMSHQVLRHRIGLNYSAFADGVETEQIIDAIVSKIKLP